MGSSWQKGKYRFLDEVCLSLMQPPLLKKARARNPELFKSLSLFIYLMWRIPPVFVANIYKGRTYYQQQYLKCHGYFWFLLKTVPQIIKCYPNEPKSSGQNLTVLCDHLPQFYVHPESQRQDEHSTCLINTQLCDYVRQVSSSFARRNKYKM